MIKRIASFFICIFLLLPLLSPLTAFAEEAPLSLSAAQLSYFDELPAEERYICQTLTEREKFFYLALVKMKDDGLFSAGKASFDLVAEGLLSPDLLASFEKDPASLLAAFGAARDAFMLNNPLLFYVDFSKLTLRVGEKGNTPVAYIGNGSHTDFYREGFSNEAEVLVAEEALLAAVHELLVLLEASAVTREQVIEANRLLCETVEESYEVKSDGSYTENAPYIRTAYGALVKKKAASEGLAAAYKILLNSLDIPCLIVNGYALTPSGYEARTYNYVRIGTLYYAVDVTANLASPHHNACLLTGEDTMGSTYIQKSTISDSQWEVSYPPLAAFSYGTPVNTVSRGNEATSSDIALEAFPTDCRLYRSAFLSPTPFFGGSLSAGGWQDAAGVPLSDNRLADMILVTKRPHKEAGETMAEALIEHLSLESDLLPALSPYNLSLYLDGQQLSIPEGESITVGFCFPEGDVSPRKERTYRVFYFPLAEDGTILTSGITAVPSVTADGGIYAEIESPGLYAVAAFLENALPNSEEKTLYLYANGDGGAALGPHSQLHRIVRLQRGDSITLQFDAAEGYLLDTVLLNGRRATLTEARTLTLAYSQLKEENLLAISFLSEEVKAAEAAAGFMPTATLSALYDPLGTIDYFLTSKNASPLVDTASSLFLSTAAPLPERLPHITYRWYKNGELLPEVTGDTLSFENTALSDEGVYRVRIILEKGFRTRTIESEPLNFRVITVLDFFGWLLLGVSIFAVPTIALIVFRFVRPKKEKEPPQ